MSKNFKLTEFTRSKIAKKFNIDNNIKSFEVAKNLLHTAKGFELARSILGCAIYITSGYRCKTLNDVLRSDDDSQHPEGKAGDFKTKLYTYEEIIEKLRGKLPYDQLILEPNCVHLSFDKDKTPRREVKKEIKVSGKKKYIPY